MIHPPGATGLATTAALLAVGRENGLHAVGVADALIQEPARSVLTVRKAAGLAGDMQFTYRNPSRSTDPETALPGARSIIAGAWAYGHWTAADPQPAGAPQPAGSQPAGARSDHRAKPPHRPLTGAVARYSWHDHYADLERALHAMADVLIAAGHRAVVVADSNKLVDRNVAWRAGLGWYGKNSNLLLPGAGSWFVLGSVVTDAVLEPTGPPMADGCGPCSQCIDDCPTAAIVAPGVVDATRCLAWMVQAPGPIPIEYRTAVGDRIYGCDDCQDVCPPNRSADRSRAAEAPALETDQGQPVSFGPVAEPDRVRVDVEWLLTADDREVLARHGRWYIPKRNVDYLRRTALVVLANIAEPPDPRVEPLLRRYLAHPEPMVRAHAVWSAKRLGRDDLLEPDHDPLVVAELETVVAPRFEVGEWTAE